LQRAAPHAASPPCGGNAAAEAAARRPDTLNIAERLAVAAWELPFQRAIVAPAGRDDAGRPAWTQLTFRELDQESDRLARGLVQLGVGPGTRLVLMVRPRPEFVALTFALFKAGAVVVLIDPGMGGRAIFRCLEQVEPHGFVAVPVVQALRLVNRFRFKLAQFNVTVGRRWFWGGPTYRDLLGGEWTPFEISATRPDDRQHRPGQGRGLRARDVRRPGRHAPRFLQNPAR
jgi:hypothetical protein